MKGRMTVPMLQQMKRDGRKIVGVVVYDYQMAQIVDRAAVDIVSVGDSVGVNMWGQASELDVTLDQMLLACKAVRRGVERADRTERSRRFHRDAPGKLRGGKPPQASQ